MRIVVVATIILLCACSLTEEVARVAIPGTTLTVVVVQDEKRMYRYQIFEDGAAVSGERLFSGYSAGPLPQPVIAESNGLVRISWPKKDQELFLEFDRRAGQIVRDSNLADHPPTIERRSKSAHFNAQQGFAADAGTDTDTLFRDYPSIVQPGVDDDIQGFHIARYCLDKDYWSEGYITGMDQYRSGA